MCVSHLLCLVSVILFLLTTLNHANYDGMRESLQSGDWHKEISSLHVVDAWNYFLMFLIISLSAISPCFIPAPRIIFT